MHYTLSPTDERRSTDDDSMIQLNDRDREAVADAIFSSTGLSRDQSRLEINEDAARHRVDRALKKLQILLRDRASLQPPQPWRGCFPSQSGRCRAHTAAKHHRVAMRSSGGATATTFSLLLL